MNSYTLEFQIYRLSNFLPNLLLINSRVPESSYPFSIPCASFPFTIYGVSQRRTLD